MTQALHLDAPALVRASSRLNVSLDPSETLALIARSAAEITGAASCRIELLQPSGRFETGAVWGLPTGVSHDLTGHFAHLSRRVVQSRRALLIPDVGRELEGRLPAGLVEAGCGSAIGLPLTALDRVQGILWIHFHHRRDFTDKDVALLSTFANQATIALENARLHSDVQASKGELEGAKRSLEELYRISLAIQESPTTQERLDFVLQGAREVLALDRIAIFLPNAAGDALECAAAAGLPASAGAPRIPLSSAGGILSRAFAEKREFIVPDEGVPCEGLTLPALAGPEVFPLGPFVVFPLMVRSDAIGLLAADSQPSRRPLSHKIVAPLRMFANQAAIAIENARLYEATVRQLRELRTLHDIGQAIASSLTLDERLEALLERLVRAAGAQRVMVSLVERGNADRCRLRVAYDHSKADLWLRHLDLSVQAYPEIQEAMQTGRPLVIPDVFAEPLLAPLREHLEPLGLRSLVVLPLIVRERAIGAVSLGYVGQRRNPTKDEIRFYQNMADLAAAAIVNAQLFEQVARGKAEWEHTFGSIPELVAVMDVEHHLVRVNRAMAERLGMAPESLVGQRCFAVMHGTDAPWPGCPHAQALATGKPATAEIKDPHLGGIFLVTISPLLDPEGRTVGFVHIGRDITESKRIEDEARQRQRFEDLSRAKSAFITTMSHELRTPLNSIIGFSELVLGEGVGPLTEKQARFLGHIRSSGKHLLQLISDILDLSKVEAGKFVLQPELLPVAQALEDILVIARGLATKKAQTVEGQIEPNLPFLQADLVRFKQILFNLLSNSVKFTPEHGTITLAARKLGGEEARTLSGFPASQPPSVPAEAWLEIRVTDTGVGIKAEDLPRLFQEFVQLETTQAQKHEGTGLGLALTKRFVGLHGGGIWAESEGEGRGSTFTVVLPFSGPGVPAEALAGARSS
jgi:PAS domain S-box-containing protein